MIGFEQPVNGFKYLGMEISLTALCAYFRLDIFDNV